ncbi:uncharacterized protein BDZ99DRAFT_202651 [Mytilinidion resinicola]|uniref:Uncharacterized protein n=1 Tax=Mytilinidion resinicola TaxID=574789 RepID=A0A6A6Y3R2_9PEZI|nr:uncharacterized protein BDZ99DRAFT_202651 [Mytilinidion resinicola]KAF2802417.1 hypothetical protein BDZ99DRAFT_202651 [Mytilinidion resinicola]
MIVANMDTPWWVLSSLSQLPPEGHPWARVGGREQIRTGVENVWFLWIPAILHHRHCPRRNCNLAVLQEEFSFFFSSLNNGPSPPPGTVPAAVAPLTRLYLSDFIRIFFLAGSGDTRAGFLVAASKPSVQRAVKGSWVIVGGKGGMWIGWVAYACHGSAYATLVQDVLERTWLRRMG